jgi:CCR4-NOT transcription complex subunit 4
MHVFRYFGALKSCFARCFVPAVLDFPSLPNRNTDAFLDEQDFPPLLPPAKLQETLASTKSRMHSVQSSLDSPIRSSTPRIPPGLSLPHAHPSPSFAEDLDAKRKETKSLHNIARPVTPALPILPIGHRPPISDAKPVQTTVTAKLKDDPKDVIGSKSDRGNTTFGEKVDVVTETATKTTNISRENTEHESSVTETLPKTSLEVAPKTAGNIDKQSSLHAMDVTASRKVDILAAPTQKPRLRVSPSKTDPQVLPQSLVTTPIAIESYPNTPAASIKSPDWTTAGRPRTLRLTTTITPKSEVVPASAVTERSGALSAAVMKQTSRQPSLSSLSRSRPSTPTVSEHGTSTGISRAGSPHPSDIVGSAPERNKSKSQAKKDRKAKSKGTTESRDEDSVVSTPTISEEVGPIISRQKKKKRTQEKATQSEDARSGGAVEPEPAITTQPEKVVKVDTRKSTKESSSVSSHDHPPPDLKKTTTKAKSSKAKSAKNNTQGSSKGAYTLNDLLNDAAKLPDTENALSELLNESISATSKLLQELLGSNDIDLNSALFNVPPLNSYKLPPQPYKGADYLDANGSTMTSPFGEIYLSGHDRKQLLQGRDVRLFDPNKPQDLLKRNMITPTGAIFRHLSAEEEERVIELENRMRENEENHGITGKGEMKPLDDMDFMNLTGGLQELMAFPPLHRISLLTSEPGTEGGADDDDAIGGSGLGGGGNNSDDTEDEMAPLLAGGFGAATAAAAAPEGGPPMRKPMKRKAEALMAVNLRTLDTEKLLKRIRETQVEMEGARREMEALEKKAGRKAKDVARWREGFLKELGRGL